jgi:hypothetical protein
MRVLVILKATQNSEAGAMPNHEDIERMIRFNEEMTKAGILKAADGLKPSNYGKRVTYRTSGKKSVTDGPFAETKELIAGYWLWEVKSMDEAMEWAMRVPHPTTGDDTTIELRQFWEPEDFGAEFTADQRERVDEMHRSVEPRA